VFFYFYFYSSNWATHPEITQLFLSSTRLYTHQELSHSLSVFIKPYIPNAFQIVFAYLFMIVLCFLQLFFYKKKYCFNVSLPICCLFPSPTLCIRLELSFVWVYSSIHGGTHQYPIYTK